jgi:hypothetical protein
MAEMHIPTEVFAALTTERTEFLTMLEGQLQKSDRRLTKDEGLGLIQIIKELVQERHEQKVALAQFREWIESGVIAQGKGLVSRGYKLLAILDGKDPDIVGEDDDE